MCSGADCTCTADLAACNGGCHRCTGGGTNFSCTPLPAGTECRGAAGACDVAESCNGTTQFCQTNTFVPGTVVCRAAVDACDVEEKCSGTSPACDVDQKQADGTPCDDASPCTMSDACAAGACVGEPVVELAPASIAFPPTKVGATAIDTSITVRNASTASVDVTDVTTSSGEFPILAALPTGPLAAGATGTVTVDFAPTGAGLRTGELDVTISTCVFTASLEGTGESQDVPARNTSTQTPSGCSCSTQGWSRRYAWPRPGVSGRCSTPSALSPALRWRRAQTKK